MKIYDFKVLLEPDEATGGYVVSCPALAGCYSEGDTVDEALENIKEAIVLCLEDLTSKLSGGASVVLDTINRNQWQAQGIEDVLGIRTAKTHIPDNSVNLVTDLKLGYILAYCFNFPGQLIPW